MKKLLLLLILVMGCSVVASAQKHDKPDPKMFKEIQEYKVKYLAQEMDLKEDQTDKFVKLYQEMTEERHKNFSQMRRLEESLKDDSSEQQYKEATEKIAEIKLKDAQLEKAYDAKFAKFLSAKQIYKMKEAEENFRRKMHDMRQKKCAEKKTPRKK